MMGELDEGLELRRDELVCPDPSRCYPKKPDDRAALQSGSVVVKGFRAKVSRRFHVLFARSNWYSTLISFRLVRPGLGPAWFGPGLIWVRPDLVWFGLVCTIDRVGQLDDWPWSRGPSDCFGCLSWRLNPIERVDRGFADVVDRWLDGRMARTMSSLRASGCPVHERQNYGELTRAS